MGQRPLTQAEAKANGTDKLRRKTASFNESDGVQLQGYPLPPKGLTNRQKKWWNSQVPALYAMKMLSEADMPQLLHLVDTYEELESVKDILKALDKEYKDDILNEEYLKTKGKAMRMFNTTLVTYTKLAGLFGMTPVDRRYLPSQVGMEVMDSDNAPLALLGIHIEKEE